MLKKINVPPKPSVLIESLRGLGYTTETALADIIDNSLSAESSEIDINFCWDDKNSSISIIDNGNGMDEEELVNAMTLGGISPLEMRKTNDLGRFGLGLKTASFSQCRKLTVASKKNGQLSCYRWDLNYLAENNNGWFLLNGFDSNTENYQGLLANYVTGTLVIWEDLDRIITKGYTSKDFLLLIDKVERHLSMIFHRFIDADKRALSLRINNNKVKSWDPFCKKNSATWSSPIEKILINNELIEIQCFVLPHKDRMNSDEYEYYSGPSGWVAQQGFYVYRNGRLLVSGSWLGLGGRRSWTKEETFKLARIRLDITNSSDTTWKIDIRKSTARPPVIISEKLTHLAEDTRARARNIYANRGIYLPTVSREKVIQAWKIFRSANGVMYKIDMKHPIMQTVLDSPGIDKQLILSMIRIIEETIPVQQIWLETSEAQDSSITQFEGEQLEEIKKVIMIFYRNMVLEKGYTTSNAKNVLHRSEPFNNFPDIVNSLPDDLKEEI